jgi:hypothetical protein
MMKVAQNQAEELYKELVSRSMSESVQSEFMLNFSIYAEL